MRIPKPTRKDLAILIATCAILTIGLSLALRAAVQWRLESPATTPSVTAGKPSAGGDAARRVPILTRTDLTAENSVTPYQERSRLRREQQRANYTPAAAKTLGYECLGDVAYTKKLIDGVIVVENDPTIRCR